MKIDFQSVSRSLDYLAETDEQFGMLRGNVKGFEHRLKTCLAIETLRGPEKSHTANESWARTTETYQNMVQEYENAVIDLETISAKRKSAELNIEVWRSINANQRTGNI